MRINDKETQAIADLYREMIGEQTAGKSALTGKDLVTALVTACMSKWYDLTSKFQSRPEIYDVAPTDSNDSYNVMKLNPGSDVRDDAFEAIVKTTNDIAKELNRLFGKDVFEPRITRQHGKLEALVAFSSNEGGVFQAKGEATEGHTTIHITMPKEAELERAFSAMTDTPHHGDVDDSQGVGDLDDTIDADPIAGDPSPDYDPEFDVASDANQDEVDDEFGDLDGDPMDDLSADEADAAFDEDRPRPRGRFESLFLDAMDALYETPGPVTEAVTYSAYARNKKSGEEDSTSFEASGFRDARRQAKEWVKTLGPGWTVVNIKQVTLDEDAGYRVRVKGKDGDKVSKTFANEGEADRERRTNPDFRGGTIEPVEETQSENIQIDTPSAKTFLEFVDDKEDGTPGFDPAPKTVPLDIGKVEKLSNKFKKSIRRWMEDPNGGRIVGPSTVHSNGVSVETATVIFHLDWELFKGDEFETFARQRISHWKKFVGGDEEFDVTTDPLDNNTYRLRGCEYDGLTFDVYIVDGSDIDVHISRIRSSQEVSESYIQENNEKVTKKSTVTYLHDGDEYTLTMSTKVSGRGYMTPAWGLGKASLGKRVGDIVKVVGLGHANPEWKILSISNPVKEEAPTVSVGGAQAASSSPSPDVVRDIGKKKKKSKVMRRNESVDSEMDAINEALRKGQF